jgi:hypothetical protein
VPAISAFAKKLLLDFMTGAAPAPQPTARYLGLSLGVPSATDASELDYAVYGGQRRSCSFVPTNTNWAPNADSILFGPFQTAATIVGAQLWDASSGGNHLWHGTFATACVVRSGGSAKIAAGELELRWK